MSMIEKLVKVVNEGDTNGAKELMHDDFSLDVITPRLV